MRKTTKPLIGLPDLILMAGWLIAAAFLYRGFFFPHPAISMSGVLLKLLLLGIRIVFPLVAMGILVLYLGVRFRKIAKGSVILLFMTLVVMAVVMYPIADHSYRKRFQLDASRYHTYLQLNPALPAQPDPAKINIFCLGGSTTEFGDDNGRAWPDLVEKVLKSRYRVEEIRVHNLGRAWYTTQHVLIHYTQNLRKLHPDLLVIMENINDAWHNADFSRFSNGMFREDYGHYLGPEAYMVKFPGLLSFLADSLGMMWYAADVEDVETDAFPGLAAFERNLNTIIDLAKMDGTRVVLMTQPYLYKEAMSSRELEALAMLNKEAIGRTKRWTLSTALSAMKQYNDRIRAVAAARSVTLVDLEGIVPKSLEYFSDDVHYKSKTFDLIADYLAGRLAAVLIENK